MLFMGQEWAATTPFLFFTDHHEELGRKVTEGRRREFRHFSAFANPQARKRIPDPQAPATFQASRLAWEEPAREPHAAVLRLYRSLLHLRRYEPVLRAAGPEDFEVTAFGESAILIRRTAAVGPAVQIAVQLRDQGTVLLPGDGKRWELILCTEDPAFSADSCPTSIDLSGDAPVIHFSRPGAVILRETRSASNPPSPPTLDPKLSFGSRAGGPKHS